MSKRRGLSLEEKRQRMLELFYEKKEFFQLKELEKIAPKEKGITLQSVKDVLQSLVDDGMVNSDRIGTSNYFWAFPSEAFNTRKRKLDEVCNKLEQTNAKISSLEEQLKAAQVGREDSSERQEALQRLGEKKAERQEMMCELDQYKSCDPQTMKELKQQTTVAVDAANRWTENVFTVKSWCRERFCCEETVLDKQFGIPDDLDYITTAM